VDTIQAMGTKTKGHNSTNKGGWYINESKEGGWMQTTTAAATLHILTVGVLRQCTSALIGDLDPCEFQPLDDSEL
jgi:hypothetical protein